MKDLYNKSPIACIIIFTVLFANCASVKSTNTHSQRIVKINLSKTDRLRLCQAASEFVGKSDLKVGKKTFRNDCSGAIRAIFARARIGLGGVIKHGRENDVKAIYRYVSKYGRIFKENPEPGDLVFFHNTYDRSNNGRMNDALTHVGMVEKVEGNTVYFIHYLGKSTIRSKMNLMHPSITHQGKNRINHILRRAQNNFRAYTTAELFAGYGRL